MTAPLAWLMASNVVSEEMRSRLEPRAACRLDLIADDSLELASVTVWEIPYGIGRLIPGKRQRSLADRSSSWDQGKHTLSESPA